MAEEFQAAICGDNWWNMNNSTRSMFPLMMGSTCSAAANNDAGNYSTWQTDFMDLKAATARSCAEETNNNNFVSNGSLPFPDAQKPQQCESAAASGSPGSILIDSTLQMMGFGLSSSTSSNWNQSLFRCDERPESNFHSVLQEETGIDSSNNSQIQKDWSPKNYSSSGGQVSSVDAAFKPIMNQELFPLDQQSLSSVTSTTGGFPIGSASYGYASTLMQGLYDPDPQPQPQPQPQNSLFTNPSSMSYSCATNYGTSSTELSPTWSTVSSLLKQPSSSSSMPPKQQLSGLHFSNNTPFWNASAEAFHDIRAGVFASSSQAQYQTPTFDDNTNCPSAPLNKLKREGSPDKASSAGSKSASEPAFKRPRIETPSPLPTFKVRKEKLGDRITALQQLVSPFGKTDTASVLHEAIEYIKFLHDQVNALSTPYKKNGAPIQHQQGCDNQKDSEGPKQDLRSRGLCLVPISSTFPMATETTADFWTPTFGGALISR